MLTTTMANLDRTAAGINAVLDDGNRAAFKSILMDTSLLMHSVAQQRTVISTGLVNAAKTANYTARATQRLDPLIDHITQSADALAAMGKDVSQTSHGVTTSFESMNSGVEMLTGETLPEMQRLLGELSVLATHLQSLSDQTERNPSSLLWGQPSVAPGPGEKDVP